MKPLHVTEYLWEPAKYPPPALCILYGSETFFQFEAMRHLRSRVLDAEDAEFSFTRFEGAALTLPNLLEELATVAMFGGGRRLVLVEEADTFLSKYRSEMEDYFDAPSTNSVLLLQLHSFSSNTKLFKKAAETALLIQCSGIDEKQLPAWIVRWAKYRHQTEMEPGAAEVLLEHVGVEVGLIDQEIAKLALMVDPGAAITTALVEKGVGAWRSRTTFEMLDLALAGKTAEAIRQLNRLFAAGENPVGILAQIAYTLRKLGAATRLILDSEARGKKISVQAALTQVGINKYFLAKTEFHLRMLGRSRGEKLLGQLLEADLDLKGGSRVDPKFVLEKFLTRLSSPALRGNRVPISK